MPTFDPTRPAEPRPHVGFGGVEVFDASEHNLAHVDVFIPRDVIVAFTGVSGSGKSSLAFGTIYAEAQRRFLESVTPYARRLMDQIGAPKVGDITGLPPAVALQQARGHTSVRSSVGTLTHISNVLRMLFSRAGTYPPGAAVLDSNAFSPNTPEGGCPACHGLGRTHDVDVDALVPDPSLSIRDGAVAAWPGAWLGKNYRDILDTLGIDVDRPWSELPADQRNWILTTDEQPTVTVSPVRDPGKMVRDYQGTFSSARTYVLHTFATTKSAAQRTKVGRYLLSRPCSACDGKRLRPEALAVRFAGLDVAEATELSLSDLAAVLETAVGPGDSGASDATEQAAVALVDNLLGRLGGLSELGLGYLSLGRSTTTLSPGELQRLRLATQLQSGLFGVLYVLDEPSAGLHPADTEALVTAVRRLRASGNSVFVIEHNLDVVRAADWIVDVGPGPGEHGGRVLYSGAVDGLAQVAESVTRRYLFDAAPRHRSPDRPSGWIELAGITMHNLRDLTVQIPLGVLTAVTGVSGSGKSTLVSRVLTDVVSQHLGVDTDPGTETSGEESEDFTTAVADARDSNSEPTVVATHGLGHLDRLVRVDQTPIGRTPRSNLATYTGLFDVIRKLFAADPTARERGYRPGRFSFNVAGGRCEECEGAGSITVGMLFLPEASAPCPTCGGARYNADTLEILVDGRTIADVLAMTVDEARAFLAHVPAATKSLSMLVEVGLGYLRLGQSATTLSGGEAQRVKLATELQRIRSGHTLYVLDEPTTGLHPADVDRLMEVLRRLVDAGNTVVLVEHDMSVVSSADWMIDLGPGGGDDGGRIVAAGPPASVAGTAGSATAAYLARHLTPA
ncbi:excinuclease ABC subunit UvrA [Rhodococcus sp. 4CII]|uniref:excinuclease ABC subunit UvrA n=1 Tax=Rhodococcus sp. 4CII TaxID=2834580 RepID=UPI00163D9A90|nr:excinuclease ABC subunit UvrA [Rhodococcus sp. 4CII]MBC2894277.1 excinuclease ABC subunit UvrA [Rhodococcus sp. 4CII]